MTIRENVVSRLLAHKERLESLMAFLGNRMTISRSEVEEARRQMKTIKHELKKDYQVGGTNKGQARMTELERQNYYPAVHAAYCQFTSALNSHPINSNWYSQLYAAQVDIEFYLRQLVEQEAKV